jgi:chromosome segregation ATPase
MKTAFKSLLAAARLAPSSQIDHLHGDLRRAEAKVAQLERDLELVRADAQSWKRRHEDASEAISGWKQAFQRTQAAAEQAQAHANRFKSEFERAQTELEREKPRTEGSRQRAETLKTELQEMRARAEQAQRAAELANEQLMAMEVKLDLIEAAIQVLDLRTREQAVSSSR